MLNKFGNNYVPFRGQSFSIRSKCVFSEGRILRLWCRLHDTTIDLYKELIILIPLLVLILDSLNTNSNSSIKRRTVVMSGRSITEELAIELRSTSFGSASLPPRKEWINSPLIMGPPGQPLAYGLMVPCNSTGSLLAGIQAHILKWVLFDSRLSLRNKKSDEPPENYLCLSKEQQEEALWRACSEVIWRCTENIHNQNGVKKAVMAIPSEKVYVLNSLKFYQDGVTEKFQTEDAAGALLLLYAVILTRGCENIKNDLDGRLNYLVSAQAGGSINVTMLLLTGRATPYLHNGVIYAGDENNYALPQYGVMSRSSVGFLFWCKGFERNTPLEIKQHPGSRLKTPALPIWVTSAFGHYGVLFNTNRELLNNYQAEKRFEIHHYAVGGSHVLLNVDTRAHADSGSSNNFWKNDLNSNPLENLIHTKWQGAKISWLSSSSKTKEGSKEK